VARLQGKKSRLFQNWDKLLSRTDLQELLKDTPLYPHLSEYGNVGAWRHLDHEHHWVYVRMNPALRKLFTPYFIFRQMEGLLVALRYLHKKGPLDEIKQQIFSSLLNNDLREVLTSGDDFNEIIRQLERQLVSISKNFEGLSNQFKENGIHGLEMFIKENLLVHISSLKSDHTIAAFFLQVIDFHNSLILAKSLHWKQKVMPHFLVGGSHAVGFFEKAFSRKDLRPVFKLFRLDWQQDKQYSVSFMEFALLKNITATLKKWSRLRTDTAYILYYLWEQFRYTRNISMLLHTVMLDDDLVAEQIII